MKRWLALGLALGLGVAGASALAQPHPPGDAAQGVRPPQLGQPLPPGQRPGQPFPPGQRPGGPPGFGGQRPPGFGGPPPGAGAHGQEPAHAEEHAGGHECPGHGALDDPHPINWWQGLIGSNNEAVKFSDKPDEHGHFHREDPFLSQLLWRYENEKDECDAKNQSPPFLASLLNFGLLALIIYRFGKKPLQEALAARKRAVMDDIDNADALYNAALKRLEDYEEKLQHLDDAREQMQKDYAEQGERERTHVLAEAEERRARMKRDVEFRLAQEAKAAKADLLQDAVERAIAAADAVLQASTTQADRDRAADDFLGGLEAAYKGDAVRQTSTGGAA